MSGDFDLQRLYRAGAYVGGALLIEHLLCYDPEQFASDGEGEAVLLGSNVLGVLTIAIGYGYAKRSVRATLELITIAIVGGSVVVGIRYARRGQRIGRAVNFLAGRIIERIEEALRDDQGYARNGSRNIRA